MIGVDPDELPANAWPTPTLALTPLAVDAADHPIVRGDIGVILEELAPRLRAGRAAEWDVARLHALKQAAATPPAGARLLSAHRAVEAARQRTPAGTIAVFGDGDVWPVAARAWQAVAPGECVIVTGGFAAAVASAIQLARPDRRVLCFSDAPSPPGFGLP
jgi:thiamine pyrophosphate-dependent acetolactate synthase large subunit-like protein